MIEFNQTARFVFTDPHKEGELISDYTLKNINFNMNMSSDAELTLISNHMNNFQFKDQEINEQGSLWIDEREIMIDDSQSFNDITD